jgi:hypothetical protein
LSADIERLNLRRSELERDVATLEPRAKEAEAVRKRLQEDTGIATALREQIARLRAELTSLQSTAPVGSPPAANLDLNIR